MVRKITPTAGGWGKRHATLDHHHDLERAATRALATLPTHAPTWRDNTIRTLNQPLTRHRLSPAIRAAFHTLIAELVDLETPTLNLPPPTAASIIEAVTHRAHLRGLLAFQPHAHTLLNQWTAALAQVLRRCADALPHNIPHDPTALQITTPLIDLIPRSTDLVADVVSHLLSFDHDDQFAVRPGSVLARHVKQALLRTSKLNEDAARKNPHRLTPPGQSGLTGSELVAAYLGNTPFAPFLTTPMLLPITDAARFEHWHLVGGSGHGKTQTLQHQIVADLTRPPALVPSIVVIDSQGRMINAISRLALFAPNRGALADRLIIIDPTDIDHPPALNVFDINTTRFAGYDPRARQQILNGVIELYDYLFGALLDADMTQRQRLIFRYLARLLLVIPGATIHTLRELLDPTTGNDLYEAYKDKLPDATRGFFETEFLDKQYVGTRKQILRRLWGILEDDTLNHMFSAPKNRIDLFTALNTGKIILVNTALDFLKAERSSLLGRTFIALTLQAVLERAALPDQKNIRPTFLYIDEAGDYFDDKIDDLLRLARKNSCGLFLAHQDLNQLKAGLAASVASNTTIKFAGGVSDRDARVMAPDMRCLPTFITAHNKTQATTTFAAYVRNLTPHALSATIPFGTLEAQPTMSDQDYAQLIEDNRRRVSHPATPPPRAPIPPTPAPQQHQPLPSTPLRAGHIESILFPDDGLSIDARLDSGADASLCYVGELVRIDQHGRPRLRFTLKNRRGKAIPFELPQTGTTTILGYDAGATQCPTVAIPIELAGQRAVETFALFRGTDVVPIILGKTFLEGRFSVDTSTIHLHNRTTHTTADWRS